MNPSSRASSRRRALTASLSACLLLALQQASAASLSWDADTFYNAGTLGGTGTWDTTTANWSGAGPNDQAFVSATDDATFAGTTGTVTVATVTLLNATGITFSTGSYALTGSNTTLLSVGASGMTAAGLNETFGGFVLGVSANSTWTNTQNVAFNATVGFTGSRALTLNNTSGTTTFSNFALSVANGSGLSNTGGNRSSTLQGNAAIVITSLSAGYNGLSNSLTGVNNLTYSGTNTLTINGNNTNYRTTGAGGTLGFTLNNASGTLALGDNNALGAFSDVGNTTPTGNTLTLQAGTLTASGGARTIANTLNVTGNAAIGGSNNFTASGNVTVTATKTLTISNTALTTLSGTNTNNGTIAVNSGSTLLVNGTTTGGAYTISSGATFGGTGTIDLSAANGSVTIGNGSFLQATSADALTFTLGTGALNVSGALANASPSMFFTLGAPGSSVISATSTNIGSGVLDFSDFSFTAGSGFGTGTYTLFTSIAGTLGSNLTGTVGGLDAIISQSGNDIILTASAIPEPSTFAALAGVGVIGAALLRGRRRN